MIIVIIKIDITKMSLVYYILQWPMISGTENRHICLQCGNSYKYKQGLFLHQKHECGKEPKLQCPHCSYKAKQKGSVKSHIFLRHIKKKYVKDIFFGDIVSFLIYHY